jgi:excisionase family DNA binding protein
MPLPDFLTILEAAKVLRVGRTAAYELATRYEATGGAEGLPVIRMGRQLRVPRARLEELAGGALSDPASSVVSASPQRRLRAVPADGGDQAALPFGS